MRITRQILQQMRFERSEVEIHVGRDRRHAGTAFYTRNVHAIDDRVDNTFASSHHRCDFRGGDVLALPAEGIAEAVDEIVKSRLVLPHEITRAKPAITFDEYVAQ